MASCLYQLGDAIFVDSKGQGTCVAGYISGDVGIERCLAMFGVTNGG